MNIRASISPLAQWDQPDLLGLLVQAERVRLAPVVHLDPVVLPDPQALQDRRAQLVQREGVVPAVHLALLVQREPRVRQAQPGVAEPLGLVVLLGQRGRLALLVPLEVVEHLALVVRLDQLDPQGLRDLPVLQVGAEQAELPARPALPDQPVRQARQGLLVQRQPSVVQQGLREQLGLLVLLGRRGLLDPRGQRGLRALQGQRLP
jgi:hypothetical protein